MNIDVSVDEVLYGMTRSEKKEMLESLLDDIVSNESDEDFNIKVMSLINNRYKLSLEEESLIINICERINP